jgi:hypothetical protein
LTLVCAQAVVARDADRAAPSSSDDGKRFFMSSLLIVA